jgi:chromosome segregation ATPase
MSAVFSQNMAHSLVPLPLRTTAHQDPLLHVERQAKHIQRNLQLLIDAQSEGLLAGLSDQQLEESVLKSHATSSQSQLANPNGASTASVLQPRKKKIGLRSARENIFKSMQDLMRLREEELEILASRQEEINYGLTDIETFNTKQSKLEKAIAAINEDMETQRTRELRAESTRLELEIHELENKLAQMKARHRHVVEELAQVENSVEAKLSSYKASLSLLESDVRRFLTSPPVTPSARGTAGENFYSLKPNRRTLEMAQEHWRLEQSVLQLRQEEVNAEIEALEEGCDMWKRVVEVISGFEKRLRANMRRSIQDQEKSLQDKNVAHNKGKLVQAILEDLEQTTDLVERNLDHAQSKDWKLLVCCISAELEALREARVMLLSMFNITEDVNPPTAYGDPGKPRKSSDDDSHGDPLGVDNPEPPADLLQDMNSHSPDDAKSETEDDEPDPAWLLPES